MTDWVGEVHRAVKRSARDRELAITVPAGSDERLSRGMDPHEWVRLGIVDVLVGQTIKRPELIDPNGTCLIYDAAVLLDMRALVDAARGPGCRVPGSIDNTLEVTLLERDPDVIPPAHVRDLELETRYLIGKSFHRGFVDPDLGPYERSTS